MRKFLEDMLSDFAGKHKIPEIVGKHSFCFLSKLFDLNDKRFKGFITKS